MADLQSDAQTLFSDGAIQRNTEIAMIFLDNTPDFVYVSGVFTGGRAWGFAPGVKFGRQLDAEYWLGEIQDAVDRAFNSYPDLQDEYFPGGYSPELGGPGLHTDEAVDASLWNDFKDAVEIEGDSLRMGPESVLGHVFEEIRLGGPFTIGETIVFASGMEPPNDLRFARLHTGHSAPDGHLDGPASKLQTFLEDGLATLQADHPDHFDEFFGYTSVPIVDNR